MTAAKEKVILFLSDYNQQIHKIEDKIRETATHLENLSLEITFIQQKELPEAIELRALMGDRSQENKVRKSLDKLQKEHDEKAEDLVVLQNALRRYHNAAADQVKQLQRIFQEEKTAASQDTFDRMIKAKAAYIDALKDNGSIHEYREIERQLMEIEVAAGRRPYASTVFPIHELDIRKLAIEHPEVNQLVKQIR